MLTRAELSSREAKSAVERLTVELTPRGFRQDADQAMKADVLRGLIEAITNADDAYGEREGNILVRIAKTDGKQWTFTVADRATGIALSEMQSKLRKLGPRTSGYETGEPVRGNRGRGAKDLAAFGHVRWESLVSDDYGFLEMTRDGAVTLPKLPQRATKALRERLGIPHGPGTVVTVTCRGSIRRPRPEKLHQRLERSVALRNIMRDPKRHVLLQYEDRKSIKLHYSLPANFREVENTWVGVPGYSGKAHIVIDEAPEPFDENPSDLCREGGILITSGRAVHESTLFSFENNPYARFFFGECKWDTIDDLARQFDDREDRGEEPPAENPFSIISRTRDGLEKLHPAYRALRRAIESVLSKHVERKSMESGETAQESAGTRRRLNELARIIERFRSDKEEEFELESAGGESDGKSIPDLCIIPPAKYMEFGKTHTFTVQVRAAILGGVSTLPSAQLNLVSDPEGIVVLPTPSIDLRAVPSHPEVVRGTFNLSAAEIEGTAIVEALVAGVGTSITTVEVVPPIVVEPPAPPLTFQFERSRYSVLPSKCKTILLLAPAAAVDKHGVNVRLTNDNHSGVLIRQMDIELKASKDGSWYQASIVIEGRRHGARAGVTAQCGAGPLRTETQVFVCREHSGPSIEICIKEIPGYQRAAWERDAGGNVTLTINAGHPAARRYFGRSPDFPGQETLPAKLIIAEVVAEEAVREILSNKYKGERVDADAFYSDRLRMLNELLPRCHSSQISDSDSTKFVVNDEANSEYHRRPKSGLETRASAVREKLLRASGDRLPGGVGLRDQAM